MEINCYVYTVCFNSNCFIVKSVPTCSEHSSAQCFSDVTLTSQLVQTQCESVLYVGDTAVNVVVNVVFNFAFKP